MLYQKKQQFLSFFCLNEKSIEPGNVNNIRPISITSTILKILEKKY